MDGVAALHVSFTPATDYRASEGGCRPAKLTDDKPTGQHDRSTRAIASPSRCIGPVSRGRSPLFPQTMRSRRTGRAPLEDLRRSLPRSPLGLAGCRCGCSRRISHTTASTCSPTRNQSGPPPADPSDGVAGLDIGRSRYAPDSLRSYVVVIRIGGQIRLTLGRRPLNADSWRGGQGA